MNDVCVEMDSAPIIISEGRRGRRLVEKCPSKGLFAVPNRLRQHGTGGAGGAEMSAAQIGAECSSLGGPASGRRGREGRGGGFRPSWIHQGPHQSKVNKDTYPIMSTPHGENVKA